ncbi:hypothetical protein B0H14DRAFT_3658550 [Mycena olivaceomarginata]|nr:hypothetical protein B0H14DRAFT_3658550 [Mycena olivaceomarginata]
MACDVRIPSLERAFSRHLYAPAQCHSRHRLNHFFLACVRLQITALRCTFPAFTVLWGIRALPGAVADCLHTTSRDAHHPFAGDGRKSRKPRQSAVYGRTRDGTGPSLSTSGRHTRKDGDGIYPSSGDTTLEKSHARAEIAAIIRAMVRTLADRTLWPIIVVGSVKIQHFERKYIPRWPARYLLIGQCGTVSARRPFDSGSGSEHVEG